MEAAVKPLNALHPPQTLPGASGALNTADLLEKARAASDSVLKQLDTQLGGLSEAEASSRWKKVGANEIAREKPPSSLMRLLGNVKNPLVLLLIALGILSFLTGDQRATVMILVMVVLGVVLRFFQELRADNAAAKLQAMVGSTATAVRAGKGMEVPLKMLVPGDIINLAAGDMVPADARVLSAKDLFLNRAALTGEALPVEKKAASASADIQNPLELPNLCFLGSNIESGSAVAVVLHTGSRTYFGSLAAGIVSQRVHPRHHTEVWVTRSISEVRLYRRKARASIDQQALANPTRYLHASRTVINAERGAVWHHAKPSANHGSDPIVRVNGVKLAKTSHAVDRPIPTINSPK